MKQSILVPLLAVVFWPAPAIAQQPTGATSPQRDCPLAYVGINTGLNNHNGIAGISFDIPLADRLSAGTGVGLSSWGWKYFAEFRFYPGTNCQRRWAVGAGVTHNGGLRNFETKLKTTVGEQNVKVDCKPATNMFLAGYYFWTTGRKFNRFYTMAGVSIPLQRATYELKDPGVQLTDDGEQALKAAMPGGVVLGLGWYFSLGS